MTLTPLSQAVGRLDESSSLPLYQQLQRALRQAIETRILGPDDALPPERDLATEFSVSLVLYWSLTGPSVQKLRAASQKRGMGLAG